MFAAGQDTVMEQAGEALDEDAPWKMNPGSIGWAMARVGLVEIEGLEDTDGSPFKLKFTKESVGGVFERVVTVDCFERIPAVLVGNITVAVKDAVDGLTPGEADEVGFTSGSVADSETDAKAATETNLTVISDAPTD
jgi:hypothetical protein